MSKWENKKKPIVIVGGGGAGSPTARTLSQTLDKSKYELILLNPLPVRVHLPATVRMLVNPADKLDKTALIGYEKLFANGNGSLKQGKVQSISLEGYEKGEGGELILENGERLPFYILVLATGSVWPGPTMFPETMEGVQEHIKTWQEDVKNAKNIVLIGGGAVGVEIAGEIKTDFPDKKVTLVHGGDNLVNDTYSIKYRTTLERRVKKQGIELLLGEYVDEIPAKHGPEVKTRSGKTIPADLVFIHTGPKPNTAFIKSSLGDGVVNDAGFVKVKSNLQLADHSNIYAAGDIIEWPEQKQVLKAVNQAAIIANNVVKHINSQPLKSYKGSDELLCCTVGRNGGIVHLPMFGGLVMGDWAVKPIKAKSLFVPTTRKDMGHAS